jgi:hypothetical protein
VNNTVALLGSELTVTMTGPGPDTTLLGTVAVIWLPVQLVIEAAGEPLNVTVLLPWVVPKSVP